MSKSKTQKSSKYVFTLKNINTDKIDKQYGIILESNIKDDRENPPINTTKISDLSLNKNTPEIISFLDESKKEHKCMVSMIDFSTRKEIRTLHYDCFWDRHPIPPDIIPIGCPIKFVPSQIVKKYFSEISKDNYTIKEDIGKSKEKEVEQNPDTRIELNKKGHYLTDGAFCSFDCAMAYAISNKHDSLYSNSVTLLLKMYNDMHKKKVLTILPAASFRVLIGCGGHITIVKFRESFNKIEYVEHGFITNLPVCKSIGYLYEEMIKF